ncbi:tetratricopeptide repeat protein [Candidatus Zixiibacteriota bacterium]
MQSTREIDDRINKCQKILAEDPNSQIFAALADSLRKKGELEKAFRICQDGLKIHPNYGSAHVIMAKINLDRGLYDWAEVEAKKAAEIDGKTRMIELLLSEIFIYKGEFNAAIKILKKLNTSDPNNSQIKKLLEIAKKIPEEQTMIMTSSKSKLEALNNETTNEIADVTPEELREVVKESPKLNEHEVIDAGIKLSSVDGVLLVNNEGLVIESEWSIAMDEATCGATWGEVCNALNQELMKSSFGLFKTAQIESPKYNYFLKKVEMGLFVFVTNAKANLGSTRMNIEHLLAQYR